MEALVPLIEAFRADHPDIEFSVTYYRSEDLRSAFEEGMANGTGPTLLIGPDLWGPPLWLAGLIQDVSGLMAPGVRDGIQPLALAQVTYQDVLLGVPLEMQGVVLYVNRRLIAEPPATVEALVASGEVASTGQTVRGAPDLGFRFSASHLAACGGELISVDGQPAFNGPAGVCWLNLTTALGRSGPVTYNTDEDLAFFEAGEASWIMDGTWNLERLERSIGLTTLAIDPWPVHTETGNRLSGYVWTENAYLASGLTPSDLEASWEFLRYLITDDAQSALADPTRARHLPTVVGVWLGDPKMAEAMSSIVQGVPYPISLQTSAYAGPLERAIFAVLRQGAEPVLALQRADRQVREALTPSEEGGQ